MRDDWHRIPWAIVIFKSLTNFMMDFFRTINYVALGIFQSCLLMLVNHNVTLLG